MVLGSMDVPYHSFVSMLRSERWRKVQRANMRGFCDRTPMRTSLQCVPKVLAWRYVVLSHPVRIWSGFMHKRDRDASNPAAICSCVQDARTRERDRRTWVRSVVPNTTIMLPRSLLPTGTSSEGSSVHIPDLSSIDRFACKPPIMHVIP
jgi:hypothetical protein